MKQHFLTYWASTTLVCIAFAGSGFANLFHLPHVAADMARLGYPRYFSTILGAWKLLGALAVLVPRLPRLKEWAYAGMMFDLTGAALSRGVAGDGLAGIAPPLFVAALVVASWTSRPPARFLGSTAARAAHE
jgi:uncharacterized membrane protein YphA (DoxX/SURF4 family)